MPVSVKISGRCSSVTNSFANGVIPVVHPTEADVSQALSLLALVADDLRCAYCGDTATEWDHFRPIITRQRPTGYISEIQNLVPSCGKCNQSKGASHWKRWMTGSAIRSPRTRGVPDLAERVARLEAFEAWRKPTVVDFETALGPSLWTRYWERHDRLLEMMRDCETTADEVRAAVQHYAKDTDHNE
jgi:hypothetical protein